MIDKLKTFVGKHKHEFDTNEPAKDLWEKIDTRMDVKRASWISSQWLSKLKYIALGACVLVITIYFIAKNQPDGTVNELAYDGDGLVKTDQEPNRVTKSDTVSMADKMVVSNEKSEVLDKAAKSEILKSGVLISNKSQIQPIQDSFIARKKDTAVFGSRTFENGIGEQTRAKSEITSVASSKEEANTNQKKEPGSSVKSNVTGSLISEETELMDTYTGTIYDGSSFCSLIRTYKFPGQVSIEGTMKTMGCSKLESISNLKAVCVKGKTAKRITLSLKEGFKNITLEKSDGRKLNPDAISHYYKGLGVISGYTGKYFDMFFKDKVELILFFKDVEEGDKIVIDGTIETVVKSKP